MFEHTTWAQHLNIALCRARLALNEAITCMALLQLHATHAMHVKVFQGCGPCTVAAGSLRLLHSSSGWIEAQPHSKCLLAKGMVLTSWAVRLVLCSLDGIAVSGPVELIASQPCWAWCLSY